MLTALTGKSKSTLYTQNPVITDTEINTLNQWLYDHCIRKKPLAYIIGFVPFCNITVQVEEPLLIPRPETEAWVHHLMQQLKKSTLKSVLELCTGTGCIALTLAKEFPQLHITAIDINPQAITCAQRNAIINAIHSVHFLTGDLFEPLSNKQTFDLIVANPPYIGLHEKPTIDESVLAWEDPQALFAQKDGLACIEKIITTAPYFLNPSTDKNIPSLIIEIGHLQGAAVKALMEQSGFIDINIEQDTQGYDRVIHGRFVNVAKK